MPATFEKGPLPGLVIVRPRALADDRGLFLETYKRSEYRAAGIEGEFVQDNESRSRAGVIRGLHYQLPPHAQGKLVRVLRGRVYDVVVDIRPGAATFGRYFAIELNDATPIMLYVPAGFAHGFAALSDEVHLSYKCTAEYHREAERGILWNDPDIGIPWPFSNPHLSEKDATFPRLAHAAPFEGLAHDLARRQ